MARKPANLTITVNDLGPKEGKREIQISVKADNNLFQTSDFCAREGVIQALNKVLEGKVKDALTDYSRSGPEFLKEAKLVRLNQEKAAA